ncbi:MAG: pyruvate ferredoxin oxidoreductase [Candidatus Omnitrophica bacterium]|nr:pyruvate ferredoxin oxidoreductase [Candidatus Omnitrophota bacterium]
MPSIKELAKRPELLTSGHRLCAGCGASIAVRMALHSSDKPVIVSCATGCLEVATTIYPYTAWNCSFIHNAFENSAATMSGVETAYRALKKKGKLSADINFIAFGGDGGTYDIGLQSLSGMLERGHNVLYICYDNEAYMNTGIQRSGATPRGASTTTAPAGDVSYGKPQFQKDLTAIAVAHHIPYAAQASVGYWADLTSKVEKAFATPGPKFINVLAPCPRGWRHDSDQTVEIAKLAVDTCFWPLYEVVDGAYRVTYKPKEIPPVAEWFKLQGRFKHLFKPANQHIIEEIQSKINERWSALLAASGEAQPSKS